MTQQQQQQAPQVGASSSSWQRADPSARARCRHGSSPCEGFFDRNHGPCAPRPPAANDAAMPSAAAAVLHDNANDNGHDAGKEGGHRQPSMKRQRTTSPAASGNGEKQPQGGRVMPTFLCIPMLVLGALALVGGADASSTGLLNDGAGIASSEKRYRPNRPAAPSRPAGAPDVDYGGAHPFDAHRHLYEWREGPSDIGLRWQRGSGGAAIGDESRRLKKDDDKNKDKDKNKWEEEKKEEWKWDEEEEEWVKWEEWEAKQGRTDRPTKRPTNRPTKSPTDAPVRAKVTAQSVQEGQGIEVYNPFIFEGVDSSNLNVAAATGSGTATGTRSDQSSSSTITTLDPESDYLYQPLRIQFDTRQLAQQMDLALGAGDSIAATKLYLLIFEILPMTAQVWGDILRVVPVTGGIYPLAAQGSGVDQLLPNGQSNENDAAGGGEEEGVYVDPVRLMYCPDETTSGIEGGADLLVYATVNRHCLGSGGNTRTGGSGASPNANGSGAKKNVESMGTLASALSCQRDQYDRPITGSIDFCLEGMRGTVPISNLATAIERKQAKGMSSVMVGEGGASEKWDGWNGGKNDAAVARNDGTSTTTNASGNNNREVIQYSVGVAVHEIGHVLGVTSDSLAYFRHPLTGHPLTRRPFEVSTVTCVDGHSTAYVGMPGPQVMQEGRHEGTGNRYFEIVTPTVRRVVRNHFNCQKMTGARLENQPTSTDCFGSHFDEMLHYTEIMGAVFSQSVNILSPLTLALLEDSGWYRANYRSEYVQISVFGHSEGCDFVENSCIDANGNVPDVFEEHFCNTPIHLKGTGLIDPERSGSQTCDPSHTQKTYCDLVNTNEVVAIGKTGTVIEPAPEEFQYFASPNFRPYIFTNADFCPVPHLDPQSCIVPSGRPVTAEQTEAGEYYGADSRCVETDGSRPYSLCLQTRCAPRLARVQITAGGQRRTCLFDGQIHKVLFNYDGGGELRIKCPKASLVCPELFCPANCAGRGECVYAADRKAMDDDDGLFDNTNAHGRCLCDDEDDGSGGCFGTSLSFPAVYGYEYENPNRADKTLFMVIVGSLVAGLAVMFVCVRQWKARQNVFM